LSNAFGKRNGKIDSKTEDEKTIQFKAEVSLFLIESLEILLML